MSKRKCWGIVVRSGKWMLALAALPALVLALAGTCRAQTPRAAAKPARAMHSAPRGQQEGIKVHGHWTIEVRKPDGKLVTHREFENALAQNGSGGGYTLETMMLGALVPQAYQVVLNGTSGNQIPASAASPCPSTCTIQENIPPQSANNPANCPANSQSIFCTLTRSPNTVAAGTLPASTGPPVPVTPLTFQGTITAPQAGYIGNVALNVYECETYSSSGQGLGLLYTPVVPSLISPAACMGGSTSLIVETPLYPLTATALSAPVQITAAGETITVSVSLSFQ